MAGGKPPGYLYGRELEALIRNSPMTSIDLVIRDRNDRILLGRRVNEPAAGTWFVPGGRILKNESLSTAFRRICLDEIGRRYAISDARFLGPFEHFYDTNVLLIEGLSAHYIVLAYEVRVGDNYEPHAKDQHTEYKWFSREDADPDIHKYAAAYFQHL